jgi:hypothetical protein
MNAHMIIAKLDESVWKVIENFERKCEEMDKKGTVFEIDKFVVIMRVPYIGEYNIHFKKRENGFVIE